MSDLDSLRVAIIGAGPAGLAAGHELLAQGFTNFTIYEATDAVGGTWRNLAKLHMEETGYPLHMTHGYEVPAKDMLPFLQSVEDNTASKSPAMRAISRNRRALLPYGAVVLQEIIDAMQPSTICFSAFGVREGYLYSLLDEDLKQLDPLLEAANELAILRARSPEHARELAQWTGQAFKVFGVEETVEEARYRQAACLLADISWRAHPDYRGAQSFNLIANGTFTGIDHPGRAYIALANYYRFEGLSDNNHDERNFASAIYCPRPCRESCRRSGLSGKAMIRSCSACRPTSVPLPESVWTEGCSNWPSSRARICGSASSEQVAIFLQFRSSGR